MTETAQHGALAIRQDQDIFDDKQLAVLDAMSEGLSKAPKAQQALFLHYCQSTGLDPFGKQIYMLGRMTRDGMKWTIQTGIDGYRLTAQRAAAREHTTIEYEDTVWYDDAGKAHDVWLAETPPAAAKVTVLKGGRRFPAIAGYREYVQLKRDQTPTGMWIKMPANQLAKCAEALALRKAFPRDLSGLYTEEEMGQVHNEPLSTEDMAVRLREAAERARATVAQAEAEQPPEPPQEPAAAAQEVVDAEIVEQDDPKVRDAAWKALVAAARKAGVSRDDVDVLANDRYGKTTDALTVAEMAALTEAMAA